MSRVLRQATNVGKGKTIAHGLRPVTLTYVPASLNIVSFSDGSKAASSCLRCHDAPCMKFFEEETNVTYFPEFPADKTSDVCACGAINRVGEAGPPQIDPLLCVYCGICADRCPVGAISLMPGTGAIVNDEPNAIFHETDDNPVSRMIDIRNLFREIPREGILLLESDALVDDMAQRLTRIARIVGDKLPNLLVRNLFLTVGIGAATRRKGNNNMRMDLVLGPPGIELGIAEVEFGDDAVLDSPRDILDDISVLVSRYGWNKGKIIALIVSDVLPNKRSEYWRIIQDIHKVTGVRVGTVTVLALMLVVWNRMVLNVEPENVFYVDCDTDSYRFDVLESMLDRKLNLGGTLRPYVEVAK